MRKGVERFKRIRKRLFVYIMFALLMICAGVVFLRGYTREKKGVKCNAIKVLPMWKDDPTDYEDVCRV